MDQKHLRKTGMGRRLSAYSFAAGAAVAAGFAADSSARLVTYDNSGAGWFDSRPHHGGTTGGYDMILFQLDGTVLVDDVQIDPALPPGPSIELKGESNNGQYFWGDGKSRDSAYLVTTNAGVVGDYWSASPEANKLGPETAVIGPDLTFVSGTVGLYGYGWYSVYGQFGGRGYLGFYIENAQGGRHYGWADLNVNGARNEFTLYSFSYETAPGHGAVTNVLDPTVVGDFNGDLVVDAADADLLAANFGDPAYDLDLDGDADVDDYAFLINWCADLQDGRVGTAVGDFDLDGAVTGTDLSIMAGGFGGSPGYAGGDANGDGAVDGTDLSLLASTFGYAKSAIPEPATLSLLALGMGGLTASRRRR